jgi:chromatin remodeling complex protein RSC6
MPKGKSTKSVTVSESVLASESVLSSESVLASKSVLASESVLSSEPVLASESVLASKSVLASEQEEDIATSNDNNIELLFTKLIDQFQDITSVMKTLQSNLNILKKEVLKERKEDKKKIEKTKSKSKNKADKKAKKEPSGFANPSPISDELSSFLGLPVSSKMARTEVTSKLYAYVKEKNLQNPENKKQIIPDEALLKLINPDPSKPVTFFNIQAYIKHHFLPNTVDSA